MDNTRFEQFMKDQVTEIRAVKKEADKKAGRDLGDGFIIDWINENSALFREQWEKDRT